MEYLKIIEIIATILTMVGVPIISIPKRFGFWFLVIAQLLWSVFAYLNNHMYFLTTSFFVLLCNFYGLYSWKKKGLS